MRSARSGSYWSKSTGLRSGGAVALRGGVGAGDGAVGFEEVEVADDLGDAEHDREAADVGEDVGDEVERGGFAGDANGAQDVVGTVEVVGARRCGEGGDFGEAGSVPRE